MERTATLTPCRQLFLCLNIGEGRGSTPMDFLTSADCRDYLSHKRVVQANADKELILIAEDDIIFSVPGAFDHFLKNIPADFDIYLGGVTHAVLKQDNFLEDFAGSSLYIIHKRFLFGFSFTCRNCEF